MQLNSFKFPDLNLNKLSMENNKAKKQEEEREERIICKSIKVNTDCKLCGEYKSVLIKCSRCSESVC